MSEHNGDGFTFDDPAPREVPVTIGQSRYVLREATENAAKQYSNYLMAGADFDLKTQQFRSLGKDMAGANAVLLSECLFHECENGIKPVELQFVLELPTRITKPLIAWIHQNSDLDVTADVAAERAKNEPSDAVVGSG